MLIYQSISGQVIQSRSHNEAQYCFNHRKSSSNSATRDFAEEMAFAINHNSCFGLERARSRKPRLILALCTSGAFFLFAAYQLYTSAIQHRTRAGLQPSTKSTIPACEIWPDWRTITPNGIQVDDSALSPLRVGSPEVMSGTSDQGCTPAKERLGLFDHSSGGSQGDHRPWSTVRWCQYE